MPPLSVSASEQKAAAAELAPAPPAPPPPFRRRRCHHHQGSRAVLLQCNLLQWVASPRGGAHSCGVRVPARGHHTAPPSPRAASELHAVPCRPRAPRCRAFAGHACIVHPTSCRCQCHERNHSLSRLFDEDLRRIVNHYKCTAGHSSNQNWTHCRRSRCQELHVPCSCTIHSTCTRMHGG